jgi:hypothetical protein
MRALHGAVLLLQPGKWIRSFLTISTKPKETLAMPDDHDVNKAERDLHQAKREQRQDQQSGATPHQQRHDAQQVHEAKHGVKEERREKRRDD